MNENIFEILFTRRHITRKRAAKCTLRVSGKTPASAARYLIRDLRRRNSQGVFSLVSIAPVVASETFLSQVQRARKALRKASGERLEILRAVAKGAP